MTTIDDTTTQAQGLLTALEVCQRLRICRTTLSHLPDLRPVHIGRSVRYRSAEIVAYEIDLARQRDGSRGPGRPRSSN